MLLSLEAASQASLLLLQHLLPLQQLPDLALYLLQLQFFRF